jgi:hypothetical protein
MFEPQPRRDEDGVPWCDETRCQFYKTNDDACCRTKHGATCLPALQADYHAHRELREAAERVVIAMLEERRRNTDKSQWDLDNALDALKCILAVAMKEG